MYIRWIPDVEKDVVCLSPKTIHDLNINFKKIIFHLGAWHQVVKVRIQKDLDENCIGLPENPDRPFTIPNVPFDIRIAGDKLYLGPVIAVVVAKGNIPPQRLRIWSDYCQNYDDIRGLIYFCMVDGVDTKAKTISGYYYDWKAEGDEQWKAGRFPYPGVVYQRTEIPNKILRDLSIHADGKVFNAPLFNKWKMWEAMSKAGFTNTPHTSRLNGLDSLEEMLKVHDSVYLKPARGRLGFGIQKVEKRQRGYMFKNEAGIAQMVATPAQVFQLIRQYKEKRKYIIQQGVPLAYEDKPVDFRVILQKDESRKWSCSGIFAKMGKTGEICTNNSLTLCLAGEALQMIFGLTAEKAIQKENEIIRICKKACKIMERAYGIYADVGIDVVVDQNLNIWVIEINKIHQHSIVKYLPQNPDIYKTVVTKPLAYAKALAGFK